MLCEFFRFPQRFFLRLLPHAPKLGYVIDPLLLLKVYGLSMRKKKDASAFPVPVSNASTSILYYTLQLKQSQCQMLFLKCSRIVSLFLCAFPVWFL